jgi:hypothetical protein
VQRLQALCPRLGNVKIGRTIQALQELLDPLRAGQEI